MEDVDITDRAQQQSREGVTVTVAVPTRDEAAQIYGRDLGRKGMQPVWIEVRNESELPYWLLPSGIDPAYFSSSEAAYAFRSPLSDESNAEIDEHFRKLRFKNPILPGTTVSGFVIVNREEAYKAVDIDLIARENVLNFSYIIVDPTFKGSHTLVDFETLYEPSELVHIEREEELRRALEALPCCTTNEDGSEQGDPLNLVLVGRSGDIFPAYIRRGWHGTEVVWSQAVWRTIDSFIQGSRYRYSPISPLYVYGRQQDLAGQKTRGTIHERNHLRMWLSPIRFRGQPVWVGQISRDIGVKFTTKSPTISTHVIDPDVDEARRYLIEDFAYSQALARVALVKGVGAASEDAPRMNLVGDPYYTDGLRAVMFFEPRPKSLSEIDFMRWESPPPADDRSVSLDQHASP